MLSYNPPPGRPAESGWRAAVSSVPISDGPTCPCRFCV